QDLRKPGAPRLDHGLASLRLMPGPSREDGRVPTPLELGAVRLSGLGHGVLQLLQDRQGGSTPARQGYRKPVARITRVRRLAKHERETRSTRIPREFSRGG